MYIKYKHKRNTRRHYYVRFQLVNDSIAPKFLQGSGRSQTIILRRYIVPSGKLQDQHTHTRARARAHTHALSTWPLYKGSSEYSRCFIEHLFILTEKKTN